ncbi:MAG: hypothetical protein R3227_07530 [Reinekea sp.]|nr:hypothetical protein [Reinekea sp.]
MRKISALKGLLILFGLALSGCTTLSLDESYQQAVIDAAQVMDGENVNQLTPISTTNNQLLRDDQGRIKVVTWKSTAAFENYIAGTTQTPANPEFAYWVTVAPQVQTFCQQWTQQHADDADLNAARDLRLKQLLGLHPSWQYDLFVEMWIQPQDVFRPCVDPSPEDTQCNLNFEGSAPEVDGINDYTQFYQQLYMKSFRAAPGVPWTGLGYTYDWADNGTAVGLSEFMTKPAASIEIIRAVPTADYCAAM